MQFGKGACFTIERKLARQVSKEEARRIIKEAEEAGLIHCTHNVQEIDFLCNCCNDHCIILVPALRQARPGVFLSSGLQPVAEESYP